MNKKNFHEDELERISGERHAGIVIKKGRVLLLHRVKKGYRYFVLPGGHRRNSEPGNKTVVREILEETGIETHQPKLVFEFRDFLNKKTDHYYICRWARGEKPELRGEEKIRNCEKNFYEPAWMRLDSLKKLNILPQFAKFWLLQNLKRIK